MTIPPIDREAIANAMLEFDRNERETSDWKDWESNKAHRYAIEEGGRHYPVKRIVSIATGVPVSEFGGGVAVSQANTYVRDRGFNVIEIGNRSPNWIRDELILALDLYLRHRDAPPGHGSPEILALSEILNRLGGAALSG